MTKNTINISSLDASDCFETLQTRLFALLEISLSVLALGGGYAELLAGLLFGAFVWLLIYLFVRLRIDG